MLTVSITDKFHLLRSCVGIKRALESITTPDYRQSSQGRPALVIGGGGTVRAAIYA